MRRAAGIAVVLAVAAVLVVLAIGSMGGKPDKTYWVELDNAFGLIKGGDLKVAGVRAGKITAIRLDQRTRHALVGIQVASDGFGSLRTDARCETRPQSLIGEYFMDCAPGTSRRLLKPGDRIPIAQTASTIAPDLIGDVMRRPYRERLSLIVGELGAGVGGNAEDLNAAIRRAAPALRETDRVLAKLADQNQVLKDLVTNADSVVGDLSNNRRDVARWVVEARDTARASAERRDALAAGFHKLPRFLEELRPTMSSLGNVARQQAPALRNLDASSQRLKRFLTDLAPFADATRPALKALGKASETGRRAMAASTDTVKLLDNFSVGVPELGKNLSIILDHLDDRRWAVEKDPRSPGGQGYTGLEALLSYVYDQTLSTNVFDSNVHYLKVAVAATQCANYADPKRIDDTKGLEQQCGARIGPNAPGVFTDDPTGGADGARTVRHKTDRTAETDQPLPPAPVTLPASPGSGDQPQAPSVPPADVPAPTTTTPPAGQTPQPQNPLPNLPLPNVDLSPRNDGGQGSGDTQGKLLDYLLGP